LAVAIAIGLMIAKFLAAYGSKLLYKYNWNQTMTMWSLSLPQVAATLAAALVGYREGLLSNAVLNSIVLLMVVTSTLGTILTKRFASRLALPGAGITETSYAWVPEMYSDRFKVMVPVYNPNTEQYLVELASLLARHEQGGIFPLAIASAHMHMDANLLADELTRSRSLLANAAEISKDLGIESETILRIDDSVYEGISRASREQRAHLIVMGWSEITGLKAKLFGTVIDRVLEATHCPVAVTRLLGSPMEIDHILVPIKSPRGHSMQMLRFAYILADANHARVTLLNICEPNLSEKRIAWRRSQFQLLADNWLPDCEVEIQILPHRDPVAAVVQESSNYNLVILRSLRRRTVAGGITISDVAEQLIQKLNCSVMILGEPHKQPVGILSGSDAGTSKLS
jgi:nucleotide-binding universal stress UspA family protein